MNFNLQFRLNVRSSFRVCSDFQKSILVFAAFFILIFDFSEGPVISGIVLAFLRLLIALVTLSGLHFLIEFPWIL